eukprot:gene42465-13373_t
MLKKAQGGVARAESDLWGVGIAVCEMLSGRVPYDHCAGIAPFAFARQLRSGAIRPQLPAELGGDGSSQRDFVQRCLRDDPGSRPGAGVLLAHIFLALCIRQVRSPTCAGGAGACPPPEGAGRQGRRPLIKGGSVTFDTGENPGTPGTLKAINVTGAVGPRIAKTDGMQGKGRGVAPLHVPTQFAIAQVQQYGAQQYAAPAPGTGATRFAPHLTTLMR